jgi:hypothetical protein
MVLDNTSRAHIPRCGLESADKTHLSRFFSEAPWFQERVNDRRRTSLRQQTQAVRGPKTDAVLILDDTFCEHVGSLFDEVDRHDHHGNETYPLAHHPVTSSYVSGPVRFPVDLRLSRRYEALTQWEAFVHKHVPDRPIPTKPQARAQLQKVVAPVLLHDPAFEQLHQPFRTTIALGIALLEAAMQHKVPFRLLVFARWSLAEALGARARSRNTDWISLRKKPRNLETNSCRLQDAPGHAIPLEGPHIAVEALVPLLPRTASQAVTVGDPTSWTCPLAVRLPGLGTVRLVVSVRNAEVTGTSVVLVSHRVDWKAQRIIPLSVQRWPIETLYQDGQGHLGLDPYRMRSAEASGKPWCLVFVAYAFLPLDGLPSSPSKGSLPVTTIGEACRQQAQALIEALILSAHAPLQLGQPAIDLFAALCAKQQPALARP